MNNGKPQYRPMILYVYRINLLITWSKLEMILY